MSSADSQPAPPIEADLKLRIDEVERRLTAFRRDQVELAITNPQSAARTLSEIEQETITLIGLLDHSGARLDGNALLADMQEVQELCEQLELPNAAETARQLTFEDLEHTAHAWKDSLADILKDPQLDACFSALVQTTAYELDAESHDPNRSSRHQVFEETRENLQTALLAAIQTSPPDANIRLTWVRDLIDRADLVLTSVDNLPADRAATQLEIVFEDLRWHLAHVETRWNRSRRRLKRKLRQLEAERQERRLKHRLNQKFGVRFVKRMDSLILFLICLVVGLILVDGFSNLSDQAKFWIYLIDGTACLVFLTEFFVKLSMVKRKWLWFRRHFLIDFIPSIPIGLLLLFPDVANGEIWLFGKVFFIARLFRFARFVRGFGLIARGFDRLARQYGHVLNQNVILYPTREELDNSRSRMPAYRARLIRLREQVHFVWKDFLAQMAEADRPAALDCRLAMLGECLVERRNRETVSPLGPRSKAREIAAEVLIQHLSTMTPQGAEVGLGPELLMQLARVIRLLARIPFRWLPIISSLVPRITKDMDDAEVVAAASRQAARVVRKFHNAYFWFSDLYGTVTPSQFVDRVGGMLVKSAAKPAFRMLIFGALFLMTELMLRYSDLFILAPVQHFLNRFVAPTVLIIGSVCFFILAIGWWLQRVAREATEFYERSAQAQFLSLTEVIRSRYLKRDADILYARVLGPERELHMPEDPAPLEVQMNQLWGRIEESLVEAHLGSGDGRGWQGLDTVMLLYRDWLDGAMFNDNDTRTTSQLLGSPAVRQVLSLSCRITKADLKMLRALDLVRLKSLFGGPYIWFNFVSRSIAHSVANLLIDYSQNAIPLSELPHVRDAQRRNYEVWVHGKTSQSVITDEPEEVVERDYVTNAFTALHFLDFDEQRDQEVCERFGPDVLARLKRDRSELIRRIFGTYPMHDRPKEQRVVNLYSLYGSWLSGGRALFLPWFLFLLCLDLFGSFLIWMARSVQEIRKPESRKDSVDAAKAHFLTAVRKIERIRGPVVYASTRLRMRIDAEYLGVPLPGQTRSMLGEANVDQDLHFLHPVPEFLDEVHEQRLRAQADMQRLELMIEDGLLERAAVSQNLPPDAFSSAEHLRAAAVSYLGDYRGVRSRLSAPEILQDVIRLAETAPLMPGKLLPRWFLKRKFKRYWANHGIGNRHTRRTAWRAVLNNFWNAADALSIWCEQPQFTRDLGEELLGELLLHPGRISEQLVTIRGIQTLAMMDVLCYREHVYYLGRYEDMGDSADGLLSW